METQNSWTQTRQAPNLQQHQISLLQFQVPEPHITTQHNITLSSLSTQPLPPPPFHNHNHLRTSMAFESGTAYPESDADDEYERSGSPLLATDSEASPTTSDGLSSNEHTPTTYGAERERDRERGLPENIISEWTADECADFVGGLGLRQYGERFLGEFVLF